MDLKKNGRRLTQGFVPEFTYNEGQPMSRQVFEPNNSGVS
jgi:hypothetical protein